MKLSSAGHGVTIRGTYKSPGSNEINRERRLSSTLETSLIPKMKQVLVQKGIASLESQTLKRKEF